MHAALSGLGWDQYGAMLVGGLLAMLLPLAFLLWDRRQRRLRKERPPQQEKLLRPAGHSLRLKVDELWERITEHVVVGACAGAVLGATAPPALRVFYLWLVGQVTASDILASAKPGPLVGAGFLMAAAALGLARQVMVTLRDLRAVRDHEFGLRGEQAVGEALNSPEVIRAGYVSFHDVPGAGNWNIDHVVVGPGGVFVLETKTRAKRQATNKLPEFEAEFDGRTLQFPWCYDDKAAAQTMRNAEWVREFVAGFGPKDLVVQPVIVVPGWFVRSKGNYPVKAMNAKYLASSYLPSTGRRFTPDQLQAVNRRLDERCRTLEF